MASATGGAKAVGLEALHRLKSVEPPLYLTPSPELSTAARLASQHLFSALCPYVPKSPFNQLLTEGFDAEQIWQQIDLQAQPLVSSLKRHVSNFEKNPEEIKKQFNLERANGKKEDRNENGDNKGNKGADIESESEELDDIDDNDEDEEEEEEGEEEHDDDDDNERKRGNGVEDEFLKLNELEEYMMEDEAREYGQKDNKRKRGKNADEDDEDGDGNEDEDEEEDDDIAFMGLDDDGDEEADDENARYEDFFGVKKTRERNYKQYRRSNDLDMDEPDTNNQVVHELNDDNDNDNDNQVINEPDDDNDNQKIQSVSTHEKEREKVHAEIVELEKANLEPKTWTMQGEVTAAKRPKNSALEVDLDFEHNARPAPAITEEITASLEDIIKKRILEGRFDDVQKPPTLPTKAPREKKEMDENKSRKGLAQLYEDEYAQNTGLVSAALTFSDEQKKEATTLFKNLCVKLDALSHFHFAPKPVIEDMTVQANVPALAMEEIAPLAVSDAAMLAPEEVFSGKGDIKEETELTKTERKRRRAKKKRKFKAESVKKMATKAQISASRNPENGNEDK